VSVLEFVVVVVVVVLMVVVVVAVILAPCYKMNKFRDWLLTGVSLDVKPNVFGLEVLSYLAYETVAQVIIVH